VTAIGSRTVAPLACRDRDPNAARLSGADRRVNVTLIVLFWPGRVKVSKDGETLASTPGTATLVR
jgi:hypothetical protein